MQPERTRVLLTMPRTLVDEVDALARSLDVSRSAFVRHAVIVRLLEIKKDVANQ